MSVPPGFGTVAPPLFVDHAADFVALPVDGLGGGETVRSRPPDRGVGAVQGALGASTVMADEASPGFAAMPAPSEA